MESTEMMRKMVNTCKVLNDVLRDNQKYAELKKKYTELEKNGKMHKMNDLHKLCEEFNIQ
tara:strand:+ start:471 stop:650 length:180 start_codon:yes stop_codon:yes gene_type:complete